MDLGAFMMLEDSKLVQKYITNNFGMVPRIRGVRFMRYETPEVCPAMGAQSDMFEKYCGKDVIYIHTRCGGNNYVDCGGQAWEQEHPDTFLESIDDEDDHTYRDHYFSAVIDDTYNKICQKMENGEL